MTADGLAPGQSWAIPADGPWQARIGRDGHAHVIGRALAGHSQHGPGYLDPCRVFAGWKRHAIVVTRYLVGVPIPRVFRPRPWHTFKRACRAASFHERIVIAVRRNAAQAGQGGE